MKNSLSWQLTSWPLVVLLAGCTSPASPAAPAQRPIAYGAPDTKHTAVVALLGTKADGIYTCSGSIVKVSGDIGYVLTAAHCCNDSTPSVVVMGSDYASGVQFLGGVPSPPAYGVISGSVYYDAQYTGSDHDFCMLKFQGASGAPTLTLPSGSDGLANGDDLEHVGFGVTESSTDNTLRRTGTDQIYALSTAEIEWTQGGAGQTPGTCQGDSGGPALVPAGAAQASQIVVGVTSYGDSATCSLATIGVASRVTSELGSSGFITKFLADAPIGNQAAAIPAPTCSECTGTASVSSCAAEADLCLNDSKCTTLIDCLNTCIAQGCVTACQTTAGKTATTNLFNFYQCVCESPACSTLCECPATAPPPDMKAPKQDLTADPEDLLPPTEGSPDLSTSTGGHHKTGCGCSSAAGGGADFGAVALALLALLRRRRSS